MKQGLLATAGRFGQRASTRWPRALLCCALGVGLLASPAHASADDRDADIFGDATESGPEKPSAPKPDTAKTDAGKPDTGKKSATGKKEPGSKKAGKAGRRKGTVPEAVPVPDDGSGASEETSGGDDSAAFGDARMMGEAKENTELLSRDRTQIGGLFYNRTGVSYSAGQKVGDLGLSNNTLFDLYLDSRLNERVRAYVRGRVIYSPLADVASSSNPLFAQKPQPEATALLNQMWLKWDIGRTVYFTAGRQFIRWGATRFWNPLDILNDRKINPLLFFDDRVGTTMLKMHVPWEENGWNFYGIVLNDNALNARKLGAAARAEVVLGPAEIAFSGKIRKGEAARAGVDWSAAVGDIDLTGEASMAFPNGRDPEWLVSAGANWTWAYAEDDSLTLGVEYFHNPQGVTSQTVVRSYRDALLAESSTLPTYTPLYTGKDYLGALAALASPGRFNDVFLTAFALTNLTDNSATWQFNVSSLVLTDMTLEVYVGGQLGKGEFRGYIPLIEQDEVIGPLLSTLKVDLQPPTFRGGLNLRVNL